MWLKLFSSEDREEALKLASNLRNLGARVEVREWIDWDLAETFAIRGRISELKSKGVDVGEWEKRIEILRDMLKSGVKAEDFMMELVKRLYPDLQRKIEVSKPGDEGKVFTDIIDRIIEIKFLVKDIEIFMSLNNLKFGEAKDVPEDPVVVIETVENDTRGRAIVKISYHPIVEVYVDVLSFLNVKLLEVGEEFEELIIAGILEIVAEIVSKVQDEETVEIQELYELSRGVVESENFDFAIDCSEAFGTILKSLEKSGILRIMGNKVKMKGK